MTADPPRHTAWVLRGFLLSLVVVGAVLGGGWLAFGPSGRDATASTAAHTRAAVPEAAVAADTAKDSSLPPLPATMRPQVVQPKAGASGVAAATDTSSPSDPGLTDAGPAPKTAASSGMRGLTPDPGGTGSVDRATALPNGIAVPPLEAPDSIRRMIEAGNVIARTPYIWGGGHGKWIDKGYDCSGSVSFVLASAGYLQGPLDSGHLAQWGDAGPGRWVTIYANGGHVFMEVAGIRFDTSGQRVNGSRWQPDGRSTAGFAVRHPPGL
jgi:cell wall-associated NlpC family hydrolase